MPTTSSGKPRAGTSWWPSTTAGSSERHNTQKHFAHETRDDGRRSPHEVLEVLGHVRVVRHHPTDLSRAFFSTMLVRKLDAAEYARVKHWRVYAEGGLNRYEVAVWLGDGEMAVEYDGRTLSRCDVSPSREAKLEVVTNPRLFATGYRSQQLRLFALQKALGDAGWLKALRLEEYAARSRRRPEAPQQTLFPYLGAPLTPGPRFRAPKHRTPLDT